MDPVKGVFGVMACKPWVRGCPAKRVGRVCEMKGKKEATSESITFSTQSSSDQTERVETNAMVLLG